MNLITRVYVAYHALIMQLRTARDEFESAHKDGTL